MANKKPKTIGDTALITRDAQGKYKTPPADKKEMTAQITSEQQPGTTDVGRYPYALSGGQLLWANGGLDFTNPMAFPGYHYLYVGTYLTYRWMLQHPVIQLVRSIDVGIIAASNWEFEGVWKGVPQQWIDAVEENFAAIRDHLISEYFVRGRDYGWAGGEPIWISRRGRMWIDRVAPLLNDVTEILKTPGGSFAGFRNSAMNYYDPTGGSVKEIWAPFKAWLYTYDSEAGYLYGRSWLENMRMTAWRDWLDCAQQLQRLGAKITGIVSVITSPAGSFPGPIDPATGKPKQISYRDNAESTIKALASGAAGVWFPTMGLAIDGHGSLDAMKVLVELANKSLTNIEVLDFGTQTPAIQGLLERMKHDEELMFNAGLRSARTGLEGKHGTKEEAGVHTDTGTLNAEKDDRDFARQVQPLIDAFLEINFHEGARGAVRIKTPSLVDRRSAVIKALILALTNDPTIAQELAECIDIDRSLTSLGLAIKKPFDGASVKKIAAESNKPAPVAPSSQGGKQKRVKNPNPQGGKPAKD